MGSPESSSQYSIDFDNRAEQAPVPVPAQETELKQGRTLSDERYFAKLIMEEGTDTYFCPRCGNVQNSAYTCSNDCRPNYPVQVTPLDLSNFSQHASLIRKANPQYEIRLEQ